jgi:DNA excision repair protein ERCC-5
MGVNNLWQLLSPVGRRINVESLERKILAVDVSIWLVQFIKAMRDDEGKMVKNAHLIGTIRRICKLMYHRIRPVFVFDGGVPALKRRTIEQRRLRRNQQAKSMQQQAQMILVAQLKRQLEETRKLETTKGKQNWDKNAPFAPGFTAGIQAAGSTQQPSQPAGDLIRSSAVIVEVGDDDGDDDIQWEDGDAKNNDSSEDEGEWDVGAVSSGHDIEESSLAEMPSTMRKGIIEAVHRDYRKQSRDSYLSVSPATFYSCPDFGNIFFDR